ncbi:MAG: hypothetical protein Q9157_006572 [Trypethelium eluteriae]
MFRVDLKLWLTPPDLQDLARPQLYPPVREGEVLGDGQIIATPGICHHQVKEIAHGETENMTGETAGHHLVDDPQPGIFAKTGSIHVISTLLGPGEDLEMDLLRQAQRIQIHHPSVQRHLEEAVLEEVEAEVNMITAGEEEDCILTSETCFDPAVDREDRLDVKKSFRAESSREKYAQRPESPPPQAPQVPAFGSLPQFKTSSYNGPPSNVWRAPVENKASEPTQPAPVPPQAPKDAPVAPKAQLSAAPPTGPRSSRPFPERSSVGDLTESVSQNLQDTKPKDGTSISQPTTPQPTPSAKLAVANQTVAARPSPHQPEPTAIAPTGPRGIPGGPVAGPRVAAAPPPYSFTKSPGQAPVRPSTPPNFAPLGPRSAPQPNTSPKALGVNVPTGPRGSRVTMPTRPGPTPERRTAAAPRAGYGAGRGSNQWISPRVQQHVSNVVPAKRDSAGEEVVKESNSSRGGPKTELTPTLQETSTKAHSDDPIDHQAGVVTLKTEQEEPQLKSVSESDLIQEDGIVHIDGGAESAAIKQSRNAPSQVGTGEAPSDDDDGLDLDLDEEDFMQTEDDFAKIRQRLEASKVDLSARHVRSSTPLRQIASLARIASVDTEAVKFFVPEPPKSRLGLGEHRSSGQAKARKAAQASMLTPKAEDSEDTVMSDDITLHEASPNRMPSPDPKSLPHLLAAPPTPLSDQAPFQESLALHEELKDTIADYFMDHTQELDTEYEKMRSIYATQYKLWKSHVQSLDYEKELAEKIRQKSAEPIPAPEPALPPTTPITESRRAHKFNTDYDVERALKESMDTHREEQEKAKREASQAKADFTKEACIPPMLDTIELSQPKFKDINNLRDPADLTAIYGFFPPKDNFTQEEHEILVQSYHLFPKKWGRIAEELKPRRSYKECINHYYATKWNGEYKDNRSRTGRRGGRVSRGRAAKGQPRMKSSVVTSEMDTKPDLYEGNEFQAPAVSTESGRPRRAAAPVNFGAEKDNDGKQGTPTATPGRKATAANRYDGTSDPAPHKTVRRPKGAGKEKVSRKTKGQTVALAPAGSPLKTEKALESRASDQTVEDIPLTARLEDASLLANLQTGQSQPGLDKPASYLEMQPKPSMPTPAPSDRPSTGGGEKAKSQNATQQRTGPSSYWSVPEVQDFPKNVAHFGTDWTAIANHMGTKTQTMVKNYYVRLIEGNRPDLQHMATLADQRRERGEDLGPPPAATPLTKRRYDNPQPPAPRPLAPNLEVVEVEDHSPPLRPQPQQSHQSPRQLSLDSRAPPPFTGAAQGQTATTSRPSSSSTALQNQPAPKRPSQPHGPPVTGYFPEARAEGRSSVVGTSAPLQSHVEPHAKPQQAIAVNRDAKDDQFRRQLIAQQDQAMELQAIEAKQAMEAQAHVRLQQQARDRGPSASSAQQQVTSRPPVTEVPQIRSASIDQRPAAEPRRSPPSQPNPLPPRQSQSNIRHLIDLTPQVSHAPSPLETPVSQALPMPALKEEARSHSVPMPLSGPNPTAAPSSAPRLPQEPRKTSNIASILNPLNDEPEEPKPRKKPAEQVSATPTPTQVAPSHGFPPTQGPSFSRRDSHSEPSISQASMQRDQFGRPMPHPTQVPPRLPPDFVAREQVRDNAPRQEWGPRLGYAAYPRASSPLHERMPESRQAFPHRASILGPLNDQSRHNPSPPPHQGFSHSRTPSYQQTQIAQPQSQQSPNPLNQSSQILQPNPYAQQGVPPPVTRAPTQTMQPPSQQQPPLSFHSTSHLSQNPHQRHMSLQHHREHEVLSRQHEESREREREQAQTQAHNAHSHAQNRYTPIQHAESRFPPPPPRQTTTTPLQHHNPHQPPPPPEFLQQHPPQQHDPRYPPPGSREEERMRMEHQHQHQQARWREDEEARRRQNFGRHTDTRTPPGPGGGYPAGGGGIFGPPPRGR